jgi:glycosyltransferase involved in cell wall biosynthesis
MHVVDTSLYARARRRLRREIDAGCEWLRDRIDSREERRLLEVVRAGRDSCASPEPEPLVTVRIATYNRPDLLLERAVRSALAQTYPNLEILVVGDGCDPETGQALATVDDPRLRYVNLPTRGLYPAERAARRKVAGSHPMNAGLFLARGDWIAWLDEDDEFTPDHVEVLLRHAQAGRYEWVYSNAEYEARPGEWVTVGEHPLRRAFPPGTVLYSSALRFMPHSNTSWKLRLEPSDWNLWKRMQRIGVRMGYLDRVTFRYYLGAYQREQALRGQAVHG